MMKFGQPSSKGLSHFLARSKADEDSTESDCDDSNTACTASTCGSVDSNDEDEEDQKCGPSWAMEPGCIVCFDESQNSYHEPEDHWDDLPPMSELWYNANDVKRMKEERFDYDQDQDDHQDTDSEQQHYVDALEQALRVCSTMSQEENRNSCQLSAVSNTLLRQPIQQCPQNTGLEHILVSSIALDKKVQRIKLYATVKRFYFEQRLLLQQSVQYENDSWQELLAHECQQITRPSVLFAWQLAVAQAP